MYLIKSNASENTLLFSRKKLHRFLQAYLMRETSEDNISSSSLWCNNCILDPLLPKCRARERTDGVGGQLQMWGPHPTPKGI
jgi:hypothetical protein